MVRTITNKHVQQCLDPETVRNHLEESYHALAQGEAINAPRQDTVLPLGNNNAYVFKTMVGVMAPHDVAVLRVQSDHIRWQNDKKHKVPIHGDEFVQYIHVYDIETGIPILRLPDGIISKYRVAGTSAVAAQKMAGSDPSRMGVLGSGWQAGSHVEAFCDLYDLERVNVYSPTADNREQFTDIWQDTLDTTVKAVDEPKAVFEKADLVICATNSMTPVFDPDWIQPGTHITSIKNPEIPDSAFLKADRVVIHSTNQTRGPENVVPRGSTFDDRLNDAWNVEALNISELRDLASEVSDPRKRHPDDITLFQNNIGMGLQFAALGRYLYTEAVENDLGEERDQETFTQSATGCQRQ